MSRNSLDLSGKIEADLVDAFATVDRVAKDLDIRYFVAGATARDIILHHGYGIRNFTFTADIDFGVKVASWEQYAALVEGLVQSGKFHRKSTSRHKFVYQHNSIPTPIDIVPFGAITSPNQSITWPPEDAIAMNVLGFEDAYNHCITVRLSRGPDVEIPFSSLAGLALMKIISWNDGFTGNTGDPEKRLKKDSSDLLLLIRHYEVIDKDKPFEEMRLYQNEDLWNVEGFDHTRAYARLMGRDIAEIADGKTIKAVLEILERETDPDGLNRLVETMLDSPAHAGMGFEICLQLLTELKQGMLDKSV